MQCPECAEPICQDTSTMLLPTDANPSSTEAVVEMPTTSGPWLNAKANAYKLDNLEMSMLVFVF
mgnify:CR=1 FL=1